MPQYPDNNPKEALGIRKPPMSTVSAVVMAEVGVAMLEGACKYGRHNYRTSKIKSSVYYDAGMRHLQSWWEGEDIDPDSGLSHITKAIACLTVFRDAMIHGTVDDDRPPKAPYGWMEELTIKTAEILEKYPNPLAPFTKGNKNELE